MVTIAVNATSAVWLATHSTSDSYRAIQRHLSPQTKTTPLLTDVARSVLIEGVLFRARYLGSTQLACEGQPTKATRMLQAEEAVSRIKVTVME